MTQPTIKAVATLSLGVLVLLTLTVSASAQVRPLPNLVQGGNRWTITFFNDASPVHTPQATQGLCFFVIGQVGTHLRYRWYSDTFPDWNGIATQEGDEIRMHGDYAQDVGHDGMDWDIVTARAGSGHWKEWRENGGFGITIGFGNAQFRRVGRCVSPTAVDVPLPFREDGSLRENPLDQ